MRILLSAYACEPGAGSERGKGWDFAIELARQGHDVTVLTCGSHHRQAIEAYAAAHRLPATLRFVWHDVPGWPGPGYENARHIRKHYLLWQMTARRRVRRLLAEQPVDLIHHLTWTVLRWPSFLGGLGPRFVFGPVGGGEVTPRSLRDGFPPRGRSTEAKRDLINLWSRVDPMVLACLARADLILVTDRATADHVPRRWRSKTQLVADVYAPQLPAMPPPRARGAAPAVLFAGRLEYWKGAQLAIAAAARLRARCPALRLTVAGSGPEEGYLRDVAAASGAGDGVTFAGSVPHTAMGALYAAHDLLLFPSLHDSGPHVIGEALAHGLPVVCLDLGGPALAVDASCGAVVATAGRTREEVEAALADATATILGDAGLLARLRSGARARAEALGYPAHVRETVARFYLPTASRVSAADVSADEGGVCVPD